jgi:hypothetical protein
MMGRTLITRRSFLYRKAVRVAMSAKASPRAVVPTPTSRPRNKVFQATPQRRLPVRQSRPQIDRSMNLVMNSAGAKLPLLSANALARMVETGKNTNTAMSAMTTPMDEVTKASPRHQPRAARPWHRMIRKAAEVSAAPKPMPAWLGPGAPNRPARASSPQPLRPMAKP